MLAKRLLILILLALGAPVMVLQGMDGNTGGPVTYGCDWCQEQKVILNDAGPDTAYHGVSCHHVLCKECNQQLSQKYAGNNEDSHFYWCKLCRAFYEEKEKVCWFTTNSSFSSSFTGIRAQTFIAMYGGTARQLPDVDANTIIPINQNRPQAHKQRQYSCQKCLSSTEKIVKVSKSLHAVGRQQSDTFAGISVTKDEGLSDCYYCDKHEDTPLKSNIIDRFKQDCLAAYPNTKWNEPFPQYNARKELIDNPLLAHSKSGGLKYSASNVYPLALIGLVAIGAIYYFWSVKEEKSDDEEDTDEEEDKH